MVGFYLNFMMMFVLNFITSAAAGIVFITVCAALIIRRFSLPSSPKSFVIILTTVLLLYFTYTLWISLGIGRMFLPAELPVRAAHIPLCKQLPLYKLLRLSANHNNTLQ